MQVVRVVRLIRLPPSFPLFPLQRHICRSTDRVAAKKKDKHIKGGAKRQFSLVPRTLTAHAAVRLSDNGLGVHKTHGTARNDTARHGTARHGTARHGTARPRGVPTSIRSWIRTRQGGDARQLQAASVCSTFLNCTKYKVLLCITT